MLNAHVERPNRQATGITGLEDLGLQTWVSDVFYGGILVIAVTIATLLRRRSP